MRAPAFLTVWLLAFAIAASAGALGSALLLDRDLRREQAGAAAQGEMDVFLDGKLARQALGPDAMAVMQGLAGAAGDHLGETDLASDVARFRGTPTNGDNSGRIFLYRRGEAVAGTSSAWPAAPHAFRPGLVSYQPARVAGEVIAAVHRFPNGDELLIGRRVDGVDVLSGRVLRISGLTLMGLALAGGGVAWLFAIRYARRLRTITDACERVEAGEMSARAPGADRSDEFGVLARRVNHMLDRVGRYVEGMRDVSDEIAHDLRTPLNRIQTRLVAVREHLADGDTGELDMAAQDLRNLSRTIDDFLWLREVEAGQGGETTFFDLTALARDVAEDHALLAEDGKGVTLTVEGEPAEVLGVKSLLVRAIDNIIGNAVKFTPAGGTIRVRSQRLPGAVRLTVEDTGPGMSPQLLARATQPGVRGPDAAAGHGLGLAIAASVARRHGGDLALDNLAAGGLCASLSLPANSA